MKQKEFAVKQIAANECLLGELAGVGGRCTGNRSSPMEALNMAAELKADREIELEAVKQHGHAH